MLHHVTVFDPESSNAVEGHAAHSNEYMALLMATLSMYAKATHINFQKGSYGALETFYPPTSLQGLSDYLTETGYCIQWQSLPIDLD